MATKKDRVIPKVTAIAWMQNNLERPFPLWDREEMAEILRYLKAAPAPGSTRKRK